MVAASLNAFEFFLAIDHFDTTKMNMHVGSLVIEHQDIDNSGEENMHELLYGIDAGAGNLLDADLLSTTTKEVYLQILNGILLFVALNAIC